MLVPPLPVDQVVPVEGGPFPGHGLPQRIVGHVADQCEQVLAPHDTLVLGGLQKPGEIRSDQIRSGQVSLVPTEHLGQTRGENKVIESLKVQCGGFDISWSHFRLQSLSLLKLVGLIRLLIKMR